MMSSTHTTDHSEAPDSTASEWTQPLWLHPTGPAGGPVDRSTDAVRDFARMAAPIALAAWMFGTALTSACAPSDLVGLTQGAAQSVAATPKVAP